MMERERERRKEWRKGVHSRDKKKSALGEVVGDVECKGVAG